MALFLKQTEQRTHLQEKIAGDLLARSQSGEGGIKAPKPGNVILEDSQEATGRSVFWVGVITMVVVALAVFVVFIFNGS
ncbi:MAG TPA: hypothetical protein VFO38_03465 [Candidatus Saccharimonadales bacterium]|nr:hypothetical protein [Candidatus Saccharimonadales bacterium]